MFPVYHIFLFYFRVCLLAIPLAGSCLWRSPDLVCRVKNALRAFFTRHTRSFARLRRASTRPEKAKLRRISHALIIETLSGEAKLSVFRERFLSVHQESTPT